MQDAAYAMYLGTLLTLVAAIRGNDERLARQILGDALSLGGEERYAQLIAIDDASSGVRRSREDLFLAIRDRMKRGGITVAE